MPMTRQTLYKVLPMAARELGLINGTDKTIYRDVLKRHGAKLNAKGEYSASTMPTWKLENVLAEFKKSGFKVISNKRNSSANKDWRAPRIKLINDLWAELQQSEHPDSVRSHSPEALREWWQNTFPGLENINWATTYQLNSIIEQLKKWVKRCAPTKKSAS